MANVCGTCQKNYSHGPSLSRHYKQHPEHKIEENCHVRKQITAEEAAKSLLTNQTPIRRHARLRKVIDICDNDEILNVILPALASNPVVTVHELMKLKSKQSRTHKLSHELLFSQLRSLLTTLFTEYSDQNLALTNVLQSTMQLFPTITHSINPVCNKKHYNNLSMFIDDMNVPISEHDVAKLLKRECALVANVVIEGTFFKEVLMPRVMEMHHKAFLEFGAGMVTCCSISHATLTNVLRNFLGKQLANDVFGVNIILPRDAILKEINETKAVLETELGLEFLTHGNLVAGFVNVEKTIRWLLSRPGLQDVIQTPKDSMIICDFTDEFPLLSTSRFSSGECAIDIKLVEPQNFLSTKFTAACWLGDEKDAPILGGPVYRQLENLHSIQHPITNKEIRIYRRSVADGKFRRYALSSSTAKSSFPIPEAPEHNSQLGDMKVICDGPVRTEEDLNKQPAEYNRWLEECGKRDNVDAQRLYAKKTCGQTNVGNVCRTDPRYFYPGIMHLALRVTESICFRIAKVAEITLGSEDKWLLALTRVARKVTKDNGKIFIKFDELGVSAFGERAHQLLVLGGFTGPVLDILSDFLCGYTQVVSMMLKPQHGMDGQEFACKARALVGIPSVLIFGTGSITPSLKQMVVYLPYYIDQANADAELVGLDINISNLAVDDVFETGHISFKQGNFNFSGGNQGPITEIQYQKSLIFQQFKNMFLKIKFHEQIPTMSTSAKLKRKINENGNRDVAKKQKHVHIPFEDQHVESMCTDDNNQTIDEHNDDVVMQIPHPPCCVKTQNFSDESQEFCSQLLNASEIQFESASVTTVSEDAARSYLESNSNASNTKVTIHLNEVKLNEDILWERTDHRVSKDVLKLVINTSTKSQSILVIESCPISKAVPKRLNIAHESILGLQCVNNVLSIDLLRSPKLFSKSCKSTIPGKDKCQTSWVECSSTSFEKQLKMTSTSKAEPLARLTLEMCQLNEKTKANLQAAIVLNEELKTSQDRGIQTEYSIDNFLIDKSPEKFFPITKDVSLVRGAQQATKELLNMITTKGKWDLTFLVRRYYGIEIKFNEFLRHRIAESEKQMLINKEE